MSYTTCALSRSAGPVAGARLPRRCRHQLGAPLAWRPLPRRQRVVILRPRASGDDGEEKASSSTEDAEPELESWQKSWVRQNPGRSLSEMPAEEPKFNSDNFGTLSILTGGVSFLALAGALWLAQTAQELRSMSPEELAARFGDDLPLEASGMPAGTPTSAPSLTE